MANEKTIPDNSAVEPSGEAVSGASSGQDRYTFDHLIKAGFIGFVIGMLIAYALFSPFL